MAKITIPARKGKAAFVKKGQRVKVINTHGQQVVDTWAFNRADLTEFMSMEHTRSGILKLIPGVGDPLLSNHRRPMLTLVEDTSGGIHDTLLAACDRWRYETLGVKGHHDNCTDNLADGLKELGLKPPETPSPLNLFMNIPVTRNEFRVSFDPPAATPGSYVREYLVSFEPPVSTPGSYVTLRAEMDLIIAFSACPQDLLPINGVACKPVEAHFAVLD